MRMTLKQEPFWNLRQSQVIRLTGYTATELYLLASKYGFPQPSGDQHGRLLWQSDPVLRWVKYRNRLLSEKLL